MDSQSKGRSCGGKQPFRRRTVVRGALSEVKGNRSRLSVSDEYCKQAADEKRSCFGIC